MASNQAPTFSIGNGIIKPNSGHGMDVGVQDDGKIVIIDHLLHVIRFNRNGTQDTTFGNAGAASAYVNNAGYNQSMTIQADGKLLVTVLNQTYIENKLVAGVAIVRLNTDGSIDRNYGANGQLNITFPDNAYTASSAQFQADGKLLVAGQMLTSDTTSPDFGLYRFNTDGTLDLTFHGDGKVITDINNSSDAASIVAVQSNGKILVAGPSFADYPSPAYFTNNPDFGIAKYNSDGSLDTSFGGDGKVVIDFGYRDYARSLLTQPDGKIIVVGYTTNFTTFGEFAVARLNTDGSLDSTFGDGGKIVTQFSSSMSINDGAKTILQPDGKIILAAYTYAGYSSESGVKYDLIILRYNANGTIDNTFGNGGKLTADINASTWDNQLDIALQNDGKILVIAQTVENPFNTENASTVWLARYNADGSLDNHFNPTIDTLNNAPSYDENATPIVLDNTVQIYDAELAALNSGNGNYSGASVTLARQGGANIHDVFSGSGNLSFSGTNVVLSGVTIGSLSNTNGTLVITFNANATQTKVNEALSAIAYSNTSDAFPSNVQIEWTFNDHNAGSQGTGGALSTIGSTTVNNTVNDAPTFVSGGKVSTDLFNFFDTVSSSIIQSDGKIIVTGTSGNLNGTGDDFSAVRYNSNGSLDTSFGIGGKVSTTFGSLYDSGQDIALQTNGKIIIAGFTGSKLSGTNDFSVARYTIGGVLDTSFDTDGKVVTEFGALGSSGYTTIVQVDGKILVAGYADVAFNSEDFAIVRYNSNGSLDTTFDGDGKVTTDFSLSIDNAFNILQQADGKILVTGFATNSNGDTDFALARYNSNGSLDTSFSGDGKVTTDFGGSYDRGNTSILQSDGKILVAGSINNQSFGLARYNTDGSLDTTFDGDGRLITQVSGTGDRATGIALQSDGKILVTGSTNNPLGQDTALVRYNMDGSLDSSFGLNGSVITDTGTYDFNYLDMGKSVTVQSDGKIVVAADNGYDFFVYRYNSNGSIDTSFGIDSTLNSLPNYTQNGAPIVLDRSVSIFDADLAVLNGGSGNYNGASVTLARQGGANSEDIFSDSFNLGFTGGNVQLSGVVIGSVSNGNGVLSITFNNNATQARVNEALSSIAYSNSSDAPPASVQINWTFNDGNTNAQGIGGALNVSGSSLVTIDAINHLPVLSGTKATLASGSADSPYMVTANSLLTGFTDPDGDTLSIVNLTANHGSVVNNVNGTFTIFPEAFSSGVVNLSYLVSDGIGSTAATQSYVLGNAVSSSSTFLDDANFLYLSLALLSPSNAIDALVSSFDNLAFLDVSSFSTLNSSSVSGTLTNGDFFSVLGTNLLGYPTTVTNFDYNTVGNIQLSTSGAVTQASEFSDVAGKLNNIVVTDNRFGASQQVVYTLNGSFDVNGVGTDTINNIEVKQYGNSFYIAGNLYSDDSSPSGISGTITSVEFNLGDYKANLTGLNISYSVFDSYTSLTDLLTILLSGNNTLNGTGSNDVMFGFAGNDAIYGLAGNDTLDGAAGNDTLDGGAGVDTLIGGTGDDIYVVDSMTDAITEAANEGNDTVQSSVTYTLTVANVENLTLTGTGAINGTGNAVNNLITGNSANNILNGGTGADTLIGGDGNDTYIADNTLDLVTETNANSVAGGVDTVLASVSYTLGGNVENLTLTGTSAINGTGNALNNVIAGNSGNNLLNGGAGNDTLEGGGGVDTLIGGIGDDIYVVDNNTDTITEFANQGTDTIQASITYTLNTANVENLTLIGTGAINGTGNALNNVIAGNSGNNVLDGGAGADTLTGGDGNDTYIADNTLDVVTETNTNSVAGGVDTVQASVSYTLGGNVENLTLTGTSAINGTGNALNNLMTGNSGNNVLDGGTGADTLIGGDGSDTYIVDNTLDVVTETNANSVTGGVDTVQASISYTLTAANVENLTLIGTGAINGIGSAADNVMTGNQASNTINGGNGNDTLDGGVSDTANAGVVDTLSGEGGNDTFLMRGFYSAGLFNGGTGTDTLDFSQSDAYTAARRTAEGAGVSVNLTTGDTSTYYVNASNFTWGDANGHISTSGIENIKGTAQGDTLTGDANSNVIEGGAGADILNGGAGVDTLIGGTGDDIYVVDNNTDTITEAANEGSDTIQASISYTLNTANVENLTLIGTGAINGTGSAADNVITGNQASNTLNGGNGNDSLDGGVSETLNAGVVDTLNGDAGNDTFLMRGFYSAGLFNGGTGIDTLDFSQSSAGTAARRIAEGAGVSVNLTSGDANTYYVKATNFTWGDPSGHITVSGIENVIGTNRSDLIIGDANNNTLDGGVSDTANAGVVDTLSGEGGNDTFLMRGFYSAGLFNGGTGTDTLDFSQSDAYTAARRTAEGAGVSVNLTTGDTSTYYVNASNFTWGDANGHISTSGIENIKGTAQGDTLTGDANSNVIEGGAGADILNGGAGVDTLIGGLGNDILTGGLDDDIFIFNSALSSNNVDTITDFTSGVDSLHLSDLVFDALAQSFDASVFVLGASAQDANDHLMYNQASGSLYYDKDGSGSAAQALIAQLGAGTALTFNDIKLVDA